MTIKKVKDNLNKEKRREAFNRIHGKGKSTDKQKGHKSWQKELQEFFSVDDFDTFTDDSNIDTEEAYKY